MLMRLALPFLLSSSLAFAQAQPKEPMTYEPSVGQEGKDVVWVPTPQVVVDRMLDMAKLTPKDFLMDLGSGDGRTVITAAKRGAKAEGIEYNPDMVALSKRNAEKAGVAARADFREADLFETDFSKASVITMFLLPDINVKLRPKLLKLRPGTRVVSNTFTMGEWKADETSDLSKDPGCKAAHYCTALLWIVPARVGGVHKTPQGEFLLRQDFQMLSGTLRAAGKESPVEGRVRGTQVTLTADGKEYRGQVIKGGRLELK
jgi:hypothetical protein